jgi:hypothetical protein
MYTHTIRTRYTFGDYVQFVSPTQRASGEGRILAITFGPDGEVDYVIQPENESGQPEGMGFGGVLESEILAKR